MLPIKKYAHFLFIIFLSYIMLVSPSFSMEHYTKLWLTNVSTLSFTSNPKLKYYLEPQLRLIDNHNKFNEVFFLTGIGYQVTPTILLLTGPGWILTETTQDQMEHEFRLWEQMNWQPISPTQYSIISRSRLEERKQTNNPGIAIRFRERLWVRIPIKHSNAYSLSLFDEVFMNLNHPAWVSPDFMSQNRAFIGIGKQLSPTAILDIGYLNQYIMSQQNQINHVALVSLTITA